MNPKHKRPIWFSLFGEKQGFLRWWDVGLYQLTKSATHFFLPVLISCFFIVSVHQKGKAKQPENCQATGMETFITEVRHRIVSHTARDAWRYTDSVFKLPEIKNFTSCKIYHILRIERGEVLEMNMRFNEALTLYYDIIRVSEKNKWWDIVALSHVAIARSFEFLNRPADGKRHLEMARAIIKKYSLQEEDALFSLRYASYHRIFDDQDSARWYAGQSIRLGQLYNVRRSIVDGHLLSGLLATDTDTAVYHFQQAVNMFVENNDFNGAASQNLNIAKRYSKDNRLKDAFKTLEKTIDYADMMETNSLPYYTMMARLHELKSSLFEKTGQIDSAFIHGKKVLEYERKSQWDVNQDSINQEAVQFAIEKEKLENKYLKRTSNLMIAGLITTSLGVLIFIYLFWMNRKKQEKIVNQNRLIQVQNEALEKSLDQQSMLLSEVHHRVKNNLQLVISLLTLHGKRAGSKNLQQQLEDISSKVRSIALIHEQLYSQGDFEKIDVQNYFRNLAEHFLALHRQGEPFNYKLDSDDVHLNLETIMPVGIILSELMSNSLKYAYTTGKLLQVHIKIEKLDTSFLFSYRDNGPGLPESILQGTQTQMGMVLIQSMIRQLQATRNMFNDHGACFTMVFTEKMISKT